jgi:hypothetical protein
VSNYSNILVYNLYRAIERGDTKENVKDLMELAYQFLYKEGLLFDEEPKR